MLKLRAIVLMLGMIWSCAAQAQEIGIPKPQAAKGPQPSFTAWNGSYVDRIDIDVPSFRGLEPDLALVYDSSRGISNFKNVGGSLGVGWTLQGLSVIERTAGSVLIAGSDPVASGRGVPAYGAAGLPPDGFTLDGAELVACTDIPNQASTPSCAVQPLPPGDWKAYATRNESYQRIRQNTITNTREVTSKIGIKSTYVSKEAADPKPFRWHLGKVEDRRGNRVDYTWKCDAATFECNIEFIRTVNANGGGIYSEVKFYYDNRLVADVTSYATGKGIRSVTKRLRAIEVNAATQQLRVYALNYELSPVHQYSRLLTVQQFGKGSAVAADGAVTGPTSLPPVTMAYQNFGSAIPSPNYTSNTWNNAGKIELSNGQFGNTSYSSSQQGLELVSGADFNGDGLPGDFIWKACRESNEHFGGSGNGTLGSGGGWSTSYAVIAGASFATGTDALAALTLPGGGGNCDPNLSTGSWRDVVTYQGSGATQGGTWKGTLPIADYNGDGADEFPVGNTLQGLSAATLASLVQTRAWTPDADGTFLLNADVNGDGSMDVVTKEGWVWISTNTGFF